MIAVNDLPCISHQTVILPGSQVQITFQNSIASNLLRLFNDRNSYDPKIAQLLNEKYPLGDKDSQAIPKNYFLGVIPQDGSDIGCLCRVIKFEKKLNDVQTNLVLKSLVRIKLETPLLNSNDVIWNSNIQLCDASENPNIENSEQFKTIVLDILKLTETLETTVNEFNAKYSRAFRKNTNEHFLLLSPLSNTLFFQLNSNELKKNWKKVRLMRKEVTNNMVESDKIPMPQQINKLFLLLDDVVSVIPTPQTEKLHFLMALEFQERLLKFSEIVNGFINIFVQLYSTTDYIKRYYADATIMEKTNLIATQLRSLKYYVNDVKGKPMIDVNPSSNKKIVYMGNNTTSNNKKYVDMDDEDDDEDGTDDLRHIRKFIRTIREVGIHADALSMLSKDYQRLKKMHGYQHNAEYQLLRNYFDVVTDIPFGKYSGEGTIIDIKKSQKILDDDHFGLKMVKKRLLEYLSVLKLSQFLENKTNEADPKQKSVGRPPILLLVGPPGVGKTSIAKSVAKVLNRKYQRISLGGVYNESDLRGHRRTYVGAMCGSIIDALRKSGTMNPLILLDELDKVSTMDGKKTSRANGDPEGALLEILDFEQNFSFMDHYVGFPVDISQVLFLCTANDASTISSPLLDRLEIINIPGYTMEEKIQIGSKFLLPKQIKMNGLNRIPNGNFQLMSAAWTELVNGYTREAGVRNLERRLATLVRGRIVEFIEGTESTDGNKNTQLVHTRIPKQELYKYLGFPLPAVSAELLADVKYESKIGLVNGLSYNSNGTGSVLIFEIIRTGEINYDDKEGQQPSKIEGPVVTTTGNLGETLEESIKIGVSLLKSIIERKLIVGLTNEDVIHFLTGHFHLHAPMGGVPKDGPSAGMAITLALISILLNKPIDRNICMTGEITLRGKVLPIGGLKEKMLGAKMSGMERILVPIGNDNDVVTASTDGDINSYISNNLKEWEYNNGRQKISIKERQDKDAVLLYKKLGLKLTYVNDIFDAMEAVWPELSFTKIKANTDNSRSSQNRRMTNKL
ncbi:hypothetical protein C6P45_003941 [Maudiozyma exigua]|uniref:Lon protease homolog n=1 Tax=Maudiozyma exigua TaxID=34358 RepID=A0A9P7BAR9_MAUEX|nr:hypothetical protein C6P45_003941 [Kazachstania exigua]